jgi:hypothetical protein
MTNYHQVAEFRRGHRVEFDIHKIWTIDQIVALGFSVDVTQDGMWVDATALADVDGFVDEYREFKAVGYRDERFPLTSTASPDQRGELADY